jgi:hypothetical protein
MKIQYLDHRHGGRITELSAIAHDTEQRRAFWFFIGDVEWPDGKVSKAVEISPICLCRDSDNKPADEELNVVLAAMNDYLGRNGEWKDHWKPKAKRGQEALA